MMKTDLERDIDTLSNMPDRDRNAVLVVLVMALAHHGHIASSFCDSDALIRGILESQFLPARKKDTGD